MNQTNTVEAGALQPTKNQVQRATEVLGVLKARWQPELTTFFEAQSNQNTGDKDGNRQRLEQISQTIFQAALNDPKHEEVAHVGVKVMPQLKLDDEKAALPTELAVYLKKGADVLGEMTAKAGATQLAGQLAKIEESVPTTLTTEQLADFVTGSEEGAQQMMDMIVQLEEPRQQANTLARLVRQQGLSAFRKSRTDKVLDRLKVEQTISGEPTPIINQAIAYFQRQLAS